MGDIFSYACSYCGKQHVGLPALIYNAPVYWEAAEADGNMLSTDLCMVEAEHFFIRCLLLLPVQGTSHELGFGIWVSQSKSNFDRYASTLGASPEQVTAGDLAHRLPGYPDTLNMRIRAHWQPDGGCPLAEVVQCDHPLYDHWSNGISQEQAVSFAERAIHPDAHHAVS